MTKTEITVYTVLIIIIVMNLSLYIQSGGNL